MNLPESLVLAVALAMDCFSVSLAAALTVRRWLWRPMLLMAFSFGLFQALMPLVGWAVTAQFQRYIEAYDHWIAFGVLTCLGVNMIMDSRREEHERKLDFTRLSTILLLAVATSIDALAVGVSFVCMNILTLAELAMPVVVIGVVSSLFSLLAFGLGIWGGQKVSGRLHPELLGGIILIGIGVKILIEHLSA